MKTELPATIVETIDIEAPPSAVYAALTEPAQLVRWWGSDDSYHTREMQAELRVGGAWKTSGDGRDGKRFTVGGIYRIVDPPRCLEFTWRHDWADGDDSLGDTIVRYDLEARGNATHLRLTHSGFTSQADRDDHAQGWKTVLGWLRDYAARGH